MKRKLLFFVLLFSIARVQTLTAQDPLDSKPQKNENIPFGKKQPPPDRTIHANKFMPQMSDRAPNMLLMHERPVYNANQSKKNPEYFRQLFLENKNKQSMLVQENKAFVAKAVNSNAAKAEFHLTKDINALAESNPRNFTNHHFDLYDNQRNDSAAYAVLNNVIYFVADDGIYGSELWRSDGTANGTYMLKDMEPGAASSLVFNLTTVNGRVYFNAYSSFGSGAWVTDGTETGTQLLAEMGGPTQYFAMGNKTYFIADGANYWTAIWETDGSPAGTTQVLDLWDPAFGEQISQPTVVNGLLYFTFIDYETLSWQLWRSDLTRAGTYHIGPNYPALDADYYFTNYTPAQLTNYNDKIYFSANDGTGRKLWVSDGTEDGTTLAPGNNDVLISADYMSTSFPVLNNVLYLPAGETSEGNALYKYDASEGAGLVKVKDLAPAGTSASIVPFEMQVVNNALYFKVTNNDGGAHDELWSSGGSAGTTQVIKKSQPGQTIRSLYNGNNTLYFVAADTQYGNELWKTDGSSAGTMLVSNIFKGATSSFPACLTAMNGKLFFEAANGVNGNELFMTDGSGSALVKDINTVNTPSSYAGYNFYNFYGYSGMAALGKDVLFNATERVNGFELYKSDGSFGGTDLLHDVVPGEEGFTVRIILSKNDAVYFLGVAKSGDAIYKTNGKKNGLKKITSNYTYIQSFAVADNGIVFYAAFNYDTNVYELWCSDGTTTGTFLLSSMLYYNNYLNVVGNTALFTAGDAINGYELWKSDGTPGGTSLVKDINPGGGNAYPAGMFLYRNEAYFAAYDGTTANPSFWKTNGTGAGTIKLKEIDPWWGRTVAATARYYCVTNGILYFSAVDHSNSDGTVFYKTDGTASGTQLIKDINPTSSNIYGGPYYLTDVNGTLFFTADDGVHGTELWKSDGTANGTLMVSDITPGASGSFFNSPTSFAGKLYFSLAENSILYLWSSDGTAEGTVHVAEPGITNVRVAFLLANGDKLFMYTYTITYGGELFVGTVKDKTTKFAAVTIADRAIVPEHFNVLLYPNPATTKATIELRGNMKNAFVAVRDIQGKTVWQSNNSNEKIISLPMQKFAAGTYFVTVSNDTESKTIKFVKQ